MEETTIQPSRGRRLVLGFDAGCMKCSELAKRIEEAVGDKLEVRSLHHPQVEYWREQALGKSAPWAPTLIEVGGARNKAWTGLWMGVALSRRLGPKNTWRVMQVLGELSALSKPTTGVPESARMTHRLDRGQFLKGVGGATVAMTILFAKTSASPALADNGNSDSILFTADGMTKVDGKEAVRLVNRIKEQRDTSRLLSHFTSRKLRLSDSGAMVFKVDKAVISGNAKYVVSVPVVEGKSEIPVGSVVGYEYQNGTIGVGADILQISGSKEPSDFKNARESVTVTALWIENGTVKQESATRKLDSIEHAPQSIDLPGESTTRSFCSYLRCSKYRAGYVNSGCFFFCSLGCTPAKLNGASRVACLLGCRGACWVPKHCVRWKRVLGPC